VKGVGVSSAVSGSVDSNPASPVMYCMVYLVNILHCKIVIVKIDFIQVDNRSQTPVSKEVNILQEALCMEEDKVCSLYFS
jgi:hypothetical protein